MSMPSKIIAVIGTHCTGKSTLLESIKNISDPNVIVDDFKVSRTVQQQLEVADLTSVIKSATSIKNFQEAVLQQKIDHENELRQQYPYDKIIFVERSYFDILAYSQLWVSKLPPNPAPRKWLFDYATRALAAQATLNGHIFLYTSQDIPYVEDPNRASAETRSEMEQLLIVLDKTYSKTFGKTGPFYAYHRMDIFSGDADSRVNVVNHFIKSLQT